MSRVHEEISVPEVTEVVARLAALLGPREGSVLALEGGITNRNFRVRLGGSYYVVRLPGKNTELLGIDREAERIATREAGELGLGPRVAATLDRPACLVTRFLESRTMSSRELREPATLAQVGRGLRAFHDSGVALPTDFAALAIVGDYAQAVRSRGGELPGPFEDALRVAGKIAKAVRDHPDHRPHPCHNDLRPTNFLHDNERDRLAIVDWEYAGMGDRFFDLGNFAVNNELSDQDEELLLEAYFGEPPTQRRHSAVKLFRFMSDLREATWGVLQSVASEVSFDFVGYAQRHFQRLSETSGDARFRAWLEQAR